MTVRGVVVALVLGLAATPATAFERAYSDHGAVLRWPRGELAWAAVGPAVDRPTVSRAAQAWQAAGCRALHLREASVGQAADIVVRVHSGLWPYGADEAAYTTVRADPDSGRAWQAAIAINPRWWRAAGVDPVALLVHEFGHALGLAHTIDRTTVMFAGLGRRTELAADDRTGACAAFAHIAPPPTRRPRQLAWLAAIAPLLWWPIRAGRRGPLPVPGGRRR